jgi:hypothetical protein
LIPADRIEHSVLLIREQKVILDSDLAVMYGVETRTLIQAVKRNRERFPDDFMFQLDEYECERLRSQSVISKPEPGRGEILFGKLRPYFHKVGVPAVDGVCSTDILVMVPRSSPWFGFLLAHASSDDLITVVEAGHNRRADVVVFVNGLPLGVLELKNPGDENATIWDVFTWRGTGT